MRSSLRARLAKILFCSKCSSTALLGATVLLFPLTAEAQWQRDGQDAYVVGSAGDVLRLTCDGTTPLLAVTVSGSARGSEARVGLLFDGRGFEDTWQVLTQGMGIVLLRSSVSVAEEFVLRGRPASSLTVRVAGRSQYFSLSGLTRVTNDLRCTQHLVARSQAQASARREAAARAAEQARIAREAEAARLEEQRAAQQRQRDARLAEEARQDSIRRAIANARPFEAPPHPAGQSPKALPYDALGWSFGIDVGVASIASEVGSPVALFAGVDYYRLRVIFRPFDWVLTSVDEESNESSRALHRYGIEARYAFPIARSDLQLGVGMLRARGSRGLRESGLSWRADESRGFFVAGLHSASDLCFRGGVELRAMPEIVELTFSGYWAFARRCFWRQ